MQGGGRFARWASLPWLHLPFSAMVLLLGFVLQLEWLSGSVFAATALLCVLHIMRACLTRRIAVLRLLAQLNIACLAAGVLLRSELKESMIALILIGVPLFSWYLYWGYRFAVAPPMHGEAMRPAKTLKECHPINGMVAILILALEFVHLNALSFNPALGGIWAGVTSFNMSFKVSFLVVGAASDFEASLWIYFLLSMGWALFALATLHLSRRRVAQDVAGYARLAEFTMASPLSLAALRIFGFGYASVRVQVQWYHTTRTMLQKLLWGLLRLTPRLFTAPVQVAAACILPIAAAVCIACMVLATCTAAAVCALGIVVCFAFATVTLLHFPILVNMLSTLLCMYPPGDSFGYMERMPSQRCWHGRHWCYISIAIINLAVLFPVMVHFERKQRSAAEVSYHVRFTAGTLFGKLALSVTTTLLPTWPSIYLLICTSVFLFLLFTNNQREQDNQPACCNIRVVRVLRSMSLCCALWTALSTLSAHIIGVTGPLLFIVLAMLWSFTVLYFCCLIWLPQYEPVYAASPPQLRAIRRSRIKPPESGSHKRDSTWRMRALRSEWMNNDGVP